MNAINSIAACARQACGNAISDEEPGLPQTLAECHDYIEELQETESALSSEVLHEGKQHRHWKCVADMRQEALDAAKAYIRTLEADREDDRTYDYILQAVALVAVCLVIVEIVLRISL